MGTQELMSLNGCYGSIRQARRLVGDRVFDLPPAERTLSVYLVDEYPACPENWARGAGAYFVPAPLEKGLWFDWTMNPHPDLAVVCAIQSLNPLTGLKASLKMESYGERCPKHDVLFEGNDRFCPKCNFKWPPQNYIVQPINTLWWDGWRQPDGSVRQFFFTEETMRGVAAAILGDDRTPAFGFAFFEPKVPREIEKPLVFRGMMDQGMVMHNPKGVTHLYCSDSTGLMADAAPASMDWMVSECDIGMASVKCSTPTASASGHSLGLTKSAKLKCDSDSQNYSADNVKIKECFDSSSPVQNVVRNIEVGAGARIKQDVCRDTYGLDYWKDEPSAIMRIYFCSQEQADWIVAQGKKDLNGKVEGYLEGIPVG